MIQYTIRERLQFCLDKKYLAGAILMDLSKAFDTIDHQLIIAKLFANGISTEHVRIKINTTLSSWTQLFQGVPHGLVPGPILFNSNINHIFFALT